MTKHLFQHPLHRLATKPLPACTGRTACNLVEAGTIGAASCFQGEEMTAPQGIPELLAGISHITEWILLGAGFSLRALCSLHQMDVGRWQNYFAVSLFKTRHANQPLAFNDRVSSLWSTFHFWCTVSYFLLDKAVYIIVVCCIYTCTLFFLWLSTKAIAHSLLCTGTALQTVSTYEPKRQPTT